MITEGHPWREGISLRGVADATRMLKAEADSYAQGWQDPAAPFPASPHVGENTRLRRRQCVRAYARSSKTAQLPYAPGGRATFWIFAGVHAAVSTLAPSLGLATCLSMSSKAWRGAGRSNSASTSIRGRGCRDTRTHRSVRRWPTGHKRRSPFASYRGEAVNG